MPYNIKNYYKRTIRKIMRKFLLFLACAIISVCTIGLAACGGSNSGTDGGKTPAQHEHTFSATWSYNNEGHFHRATCHPDIIDEVIPHELGEMHVVEENGNFYEQRDCVCGYKVREVHHHEYSYGEVIKEPTCTEFGEQEIICDTCGHVSSESIMYLTHDIEHHDYKAPTCTEFGWYEYETCSRCDYTTYVEIPALEHDITHHEAKEPTCTEIGWNAYDECTRCDYTTYVEIPATGHSYEEAWSYDEDFHWHETTCGHHDSDAYNKKSHVLGKWEVITPAGLVDNGVERRSCATCGYYEERVLSRLCGLTLMGETYQIRGGSSELSGDIVIPEEKDGIPITKIDYGFNDLPNITSVTISKNIISISNSFKNCPKLKTVYWDAEHYTANIGADITDSNSMFYYVEKVAVLEHGNMRCFDPIYSDEYVLPYLKNVYEFEVADNNPNHKVEKATVERSGETFAIGVLMTKDGSGLCAIPRQHYGDTLYLTDLTFDHVASYAFYKAEYGKIELPNTVKVIGSGAYSYSKVSTVTIPESVNKIVSYAFSNCKNLTTFNWNAIDAELSVENNSAGFFNRCTALTTLKFGKKVAKLYKFYDMAECTSLKNVRYDGTVSGWNAINKPMYWKGDILATEVVCTNGSVAIS